MEPVEDLLRQHFRRPLGPAARQLFARLPVERPVVRLAPGFWVVSGSETVRRLAASPRLTMVPIAFPPPARREVPEFAEFFEGSLSFRERPEHHRLRRVVSAHFTPAGTEALRGGVQALVDDLLAGVADGEPFDVVAQLTDRLPMRVMGLLLGAPAHDHDALAQRGLSMLTRIAASFPGMAAEGPPPITRAGFADLADYVDRLLTDAPVPGSLTADLRGAVDRGELTRREARDLVLLLFMTGVDTVSAALATTVDLLLENPAVLDGVTGGRYALADVLAEATRIDTPLPFANRCVTDDVELGPAATAHAGDQVILCLAGANLDPARFEDPLAFRPGRRPPSLTFGHGTYRCIGALLAGLQSEALLSALLARGLTRGPGTVRWRSDITFHTPRHLPVRLGARPATRTAELAGVLS